MTAVDRVVAPANGLSVPVKVLPVGHVCVPASTRAEQLVAAAAWARDGLSRGEQCVYLAEHADDPQLREALDPDHTAAPDALAILLHAASYDGQFEPKRTLAWIQDTIDAGLRAGHTGVRVCVENVSIAAAQYEQLGEYEMLLNELLRDRPAVVTCIYDRNRIPASIIREAFVTHPLVWVHEVVCRNPRYVAPEHRVASDRPVGEISSFLDQLHAEEMKTVRHRAWLRTTLSKLEAERNAISRMLHDVVGQSLVAVSLTCGDEAVPVVDDAIEIIRAAARDLRPEVLDDLGLVAAVRSLATRQAMRGNLTLSLDLAANDAQLGAEIVTACYRIIEGALANVVAHAHAKILAVTLRSEPGAFVLVVSDDGIGLAPSARAGTGLVDMAERAELVGGRLEVESRPGGTTIRVRVPT